ncbi:hypothetical protein [Bradyrhizobium sp. ERR14]|uniref:hypothetical protein n=1 Tax=Bradyrhizobium sp. ERR14 TaxID=2663837 RepID=UPI0016139DF9|nr:hypothetical protein [Bradyrhizobium sp. ERR14]MBB4396519.1 hypothetical protein [Bradyrhizobium sp. ERR14]
MIAIVRRMTAPLQVKYSGISALSRSLIAPACAPPTAGAIQRGLAAMEASGQGFVVLNELAEAVGRKLAALTGAEWGLVTAGSAAAVSQAVAACVAGDDPEKMLKLPLRDERMVVVAADQRMAYEHAIRAVGCGVASYRPCRRPGSAFSWEDRSNMPCCLRYSKVGLVL